MLPALSAPSVLLKNTRTLALPGVARVDADPEALTGEWQQAERHRAEAEHHTFEGELVNDRDAVAEYLSAAGIELEAAKGLLISVYA